MTTNTLDLAAIYSKFPFLSHTASTKRQPPPPRAVSTRIAHHRDSPAALSPVNLNDVLADVTRSKNMFRYIVHSSWQFFGNTSHRSDSTQSRYVTKSPALSMSCLRE